MSTFTMAFVSGAKYTFCPKLRSSVIFGKEVTQPSKYSDHAARTLRYLRDAKGAGKVIHHLFEWKGGALESFTDWQIKDYIVSKK